MKFHEGFRSGHQTIELACGTCLECDISFPSASTYPSSERIDDLGAPKLAVCLHPWPWLGGTMNDPVLQLLVDPLCSQNYYVIRYNSRGVGKSSGWPSLTGSREGLDLRELVQWTVQRIPSVTSVVIVGYSYGSLIASLHPVLPELQVSHVLISYPLGPRHWLTAFHGKTYTEELNTLLRDPRSNVLVLYGDQDDFTSVENYEQWVKKLQCELDREAKLQIVKVENASHFWRERGAASRLLAALEAWLSL